MKIKILSVLIFIIGFNAHCQNLIGTRWLKVKEERKDGSQIHYRSGASNSYSEYYFKSLNKVAINSIRTLANYEIKNSELTIGNQKYIVEKLSATELVICEKGKINTSNDKTNRLYFIEDKKLIDYLLENKLLSFINDSTVIAKKYLEPKLKNNENLSSVITKSLRGQSFSKSKEKDYRTGFLIGYFNINTSGKIDKIEISQNSEIYENIEKKFIKALKKLDFTPIEIKKKYNQMVDFNVVFRQFRGGVSGIHITTNTNKTPFTGKQDLTIKEKEKSQQFFQDGVRQFTQKSYLEALTMFNKVIAIDSLFFDAYYNRAYTNMTINNLNDSCKDWGYLKKMKQIEGARLYEQKCE